MSSNLGSILSDTAVPTGNFNLWHLITFCSSNKVLRFIIWCAYIPYFLTFRSDIDPKWKKAAAYKKEKVQEDEEEDDDENVSCF